MCVRGFPARLHVHLVGLRRREGKVPPAWHHARESDRPGQVSRAWRRRSSSPPSGRYWSGSWFSARRASAGSSGGLDEEFRRIRSEEHTSELQSPMRTSYAVFCLKKKKRNAEHSTPVGPLTP